MGAITEMSPRRFQTDFDRRCLIPEVPHLQAGGNGVVSLGGSDCPKAGGQVHVMRRWVRFASRGT